MQLLSVTDLIAFVAKLASDPFNFAEFPIYEHYGDMSAELTQAHFQHAALVLF